MTTTRYLRIVAATAVLAGLAVCAVASFGAEAAGLINPPIPPRDTPVTFWDKLGFGRMRDATLNRRGNNPQREWKMPLKRIGDPANMLSGNQAIATAAKIKIDQDLAPQKIKAIKYLATICCGCKGYKKEVQEALLASLDDCTEEVRYQAAIALCECTGNICQTCNSPSCCSAEVMNKLNEVATKKDESGCFVEPSARVRAAALNALNACRAVHAPTTTEEAPKPKERPLEGVQPGSEPTLAPPPPKTTHQEPRSGVHSASYTLLLDSATPSGSQWLRASAVLDSRWQGSILAVAPSPKSK
jgi:hypothetical protein